MSELIITKGDITKEEVDVIVNAAKQSLLGGGGVDGAIHAAAGPKLLEACRQIGGCKTGEAVLTKGYNLPSKYVIHTPGPDCRGVKDLTEARQLLHNSYENSLKLAKRAGLKSIAFPSISTGIYDFPLEEGAKIAVNTICDFLKENKDMTAKMVLFDNDTYNAYEKAMCERNEKRVMTIEKTYSQENLERQ